MPCGLLNCTWNPNDIRGKFIDNRCLLKEKIRYISFPIPNLHKTYLWLAQLNVDFLKIISFNNCRHA